MKEVTNDFENQKLLTVKELAEYISVSYKTARKMLSEPNCPYVFKIASRRYANKTLLDKWIDNNTGR